MDCVELPPDPTAASRARRWLEARLRRHQWAPDQVDDALLLFSELVTNASRVASDHVDARVDFVQDDVVIEVTDDGPGVPDPRPFVEAIVSGRGLKIVETVSDGWGIRWDGGRKTVWFRLARRAPTRHRLERHDDTLLPA